MILVDKHIQQLVSNDQLIVHGYNPNHLGSISYDLTIDKIIAFEQEKNIELQQYELQPNEFIIIKTIEKLKIPNNLLGRIEEKNSLIRMGLVVSGPCYQPGHETFCYLRVYNISKQPIQLYHDFIIAQIMFEQLENTPLETYDMKKDASFNNEINYLGFGKYDKQYKKMLL